MVRHMFNVISLSMGSSLCPCLGSLLYSYRNRKPWLIRSSVHIASGHCEDIVCSVVGRVEEKRPVPASARSVTAWSTTVSAAPAAVGWSAVPKATSTTTSREAAAATTTTAGHAWQVGALGCDLYRY